MNDCDNYIARYFLRDRDANTFLQALLDSGVPLCVLTESLENYAKETIAIYPHDLVNYEEMANSFLMDHYGAREMGEPIAEWSDQFDSNEC